MTNKLKYFVANWKMFGNFTYLKNFQKVHNFLALNKKLRKKNKVILCIPNTLLYFYKKKINSKFISLGAQNCHYLQKFGPYTGSISSYMLKTVGTKYVILGHSENRSQGETNKIICKKIQSSLNQNLKVIFCIGETLKEKRRKKTFFILKRQITSSIKKNFNLNKIIIAYEPVWSIGTGKIPKVKELEKTFKFIKIVFKKSLKVKKPPTILYGGSVNSSNVRKFSFISDIDGFLIGSASISSKNFIDIIKNYYK